MTGDQATPVLRATGVGAGFGDKSVLNDVTVVMRRGEMAALLGRNGVGKSTLLRVFSGVLTPSRGTVMLNGRSLDRMSRRETARHVAVAPDDLHVPFAFTVEEVVAMGRTAHMRFLHGESARDRRAIQCALRLLNLGALASRLYNSLSAGERQRVVLAQALAQEPILLLLDEPTVHLDLAHQVEILCLVRTLNRAEGVTVLAAIHDVNLAALLFDRLIFLQDGHVVADGPPAETVTVDTVRQVYGASVRVYDHPTSGVPQVTLLVPPTSIKSFAV